MPLSSLLLQTVGEEAVENALKAVRPFVDYMSAVLTTNADGERLV